MNEQELCECGQPENSIRHSNADGGSLDAHKFKPTAERPWGKAGRAAQPADGAPSEIWQRAMAAVCRGCREGLPCSEDGAHEPIGKQWFSCDAEAIREEMNRWQREARKEKVFSVIESALKQPAGRERGGDEHNVDLLTQLIAQWQERRKDLDALSNGSGSDKLQGMHWDAVADEVGEFIRDLKMLERVAAAPPAPAQPADGALREALEQLILDMRWAAKVMPVNRENFPKICNDFANRAERALAAQKEPGK